MRDGTAITSILFTRLENAPALIEELGPTDSSSLLDEHHDRAAQLLAEYGGEELQWMGDGLMAAFSSPVTAVDCAVAMQRAARGRIMNHQLHVCMGLEAGEILRQETGSGYFGSAVVIAARLCARASPGQILVSDLIVGLLGQGTTLRVHELGAANLKGIHGEIEIAEILFGN